VRVVRVRVCACVCEREGEYLGERFQLFKVEIVSITGVHPPVFFEVRNGLCVRVCVCESA